MSTPSKDDLFPPVQQAGASYYAATSFILSLVAVILIWVSRYAIPIAARNAVAVGDFGNMYTFAIVSIGVIVLLSILALGLGIIAARRRSRLLLAGAGIALSATSLIEVSLTLFITIAFPTFVV